MVDYKTYKIDFHHNILHDHHYVCQMNTNVMIIYKHIATIISEIKKDLHDTLTHQHQNLCYENKKEKTNNNGGF